MTAREFKKLVEAAGVRDDEHVDDLIRTGYKPSAN